MSCKKNHNTPTVIDKAGFTLVELMIVVFVSSLVMAAVVTVYIAQSRSYSEHDDIASIQQGLRGALSILSMEIRQAGCDPTESDVPGILAATGTGFQFTMDVRGNAVNPNAADGDVDDVDENVVYGFAADTDNDGIVDNGGVNWNGTGTLGRAIGGGVLEPLADNIEALEFNYILEDGTTSLAPANLGNIRAVQVSLLARAANPAQGFLNTSTYTTASGVVWDPPNDNFRRRLMVINIQCRNMGY
ncbi:MAG: PilW family protein [Pseudomonadota bacterium]